MDKIQQTKENCCKPTKLEEFAQPFKFLYKFLDGYGEKKTLHLEIQSYTSPPLGLGAIRGYCSNPSLVPPKKRAFYFKLMGELLNRIIEKKEATARNFIGEIEPQKKNLIKTIKSI